MGNVFSRSLLAAGGGLAVLILIAAFIFPSGRPADPPRRKPSPSAVAAPEPNIPVVEPTSGYTGSAACQSCHKDQHGSWHQSYHRTMTQFATDESVLGDFNNVHLSGREFDVRLFKEDGKFKAEIKLANSSSTRVFTVVMTTGSHVRQAYWLTSPDERELMILPYMYLRAEGRWIPRLSAYIRKIPPDESPEFQAFLAEKGRWSLGCIKCHATFGQPIPVDQAGHRAATSRVAELGISCEACHGPGAAHVRAMREPGEAHAKAMAIINPAKLSHDRSSQVCGQCHSVFFRRSDPANSEWLRDGFAYRPGDDLFADPTRFVQRGRVELMPDRPAHVPDPVGSGCYWSDGMSRATGREFSGVVESPCYQRGSMSCLSCHEMHQHSGDTRTSAEWAAGQLKPGMDGNRGCVQCHDRFEDAAVAASHTHHRADSAGSQCYNCHLPHTTYGLLKAARSHTVSSPSAAASLQTGRPNACNLCHQDKTLAWTAEILASWHSQSIPDLSEDETKVAASILWALRGDAVQRALVAWSFGWADAHAASGADWQAPFLGELLNDRYDAVRIIAHRSLKHLPGFDDFEFDFRSGPATRAAAVMNARNIWQKTLDGHNPRFADQMLIDSAGRIADADFQRLLKQRDDRPVEVAE